MVFGGFVRGALCGGSLVNGEKLRDLASGWGACWHEGAVANKIDMRFGLKRGL